MISKIRMRRGERGKTRTRRTARRRRSSPEEWSLFPVCGGPSGCCGIDPGSFAVALVVV
jgi:hypothetical protein